MSKYDFTEQAQQDLIPIRRYTLMHWGVPQSKSYLEKFKKTIELLSEMPLIGKNCFIYINKDIYQYLYGSHAIYYLNTIHSITIIAVLHQNMVPEDSLKIRLSQRGNSVIQPF